jgi:hypothetical protein
VLEHTAPFLSVIFHEYEGYIGGLEKTNRDIHAARSDRDKWLRNYEMAVMASEKHEQEVREEARLAIAKIEARLKGVAGLSDLVTRTEQLEQQLVVAKREGVELRAKLDAVAVVKVDFQNAVHYVEQAFLSMSQERDLELAQQAVETKLIRKELQALQTQARNQLLDMTAAKDAVEILLANAQQREQQLGLRVEGLEMRNSALMAKSLSRVGAVDESRRLLTPRPNHTQCRNRVPQLGAAVDGNTTEGLIDALLDRIDDLRAKLCDAQDLTDCMELRVAETIRRQVESRLAAAVAQPPPPPPQVSQGEGSVEDPPQVSEADPASCPTSPVL